MLHELVIPPRNFFGEGALQLLGSHLTDLGVSRALVVTDQGLVGLGMLEPVLAILRDAGIAATPFHGLAGEPMLSAVEAAAEKYRADDCQGIVGLGGGSPNDLAKAVGILVANNGDLRDYVGLNGSHTPSVPLVLINTTSGTASELSRAFIISDDVTKQKLVFKDNHALASVTINDPTLMRDLPASVTGATGMDALAHATEAYVSARAQELAGSLAEGAVHLVMRHLEGAVQEPTDMDHRLGMVHAQSLAGMAFGSAGVGLVHAIAHPLGTMKKLPHGRCVGLMLPYVVAWNARSVAPAYARLARRVLPEVATLDDAEALRALLRRYRQLSEVAGTAALPEGVSLDDGEVRALAQAAVVEPNCPNNPAQPIVDDVVGIIRAALEGGEPTC